ncbi:MAG: energy transducer TonB [Candidatus Nitrospinota bacterium M3_3B_026]
MSRAEEKFFLLSVAAHIFLFQLSGLIFVMPERGGPPPVRVRVIGQDIPGAVELESGRIANLPEPGKKEEPEDSKILARFDSRSHGPEKGDRKKSLETLLPSGAAATEKAEKAVENAPADKTMEAATPAREREGQTGEPDPFSSEVIRAERPEKAVEEKTESPEAAGEAKVSMLTGAQRRAAPDTGDVIELGDEAVVSLNTRAFEYVDYFTAIRKAINLVWAYPEGAASRSLSGRTVIRFSLSSDGALEEVKVLESSGHRALDDEARLAIRLAAPYEAFPPALDKKRLHIVATFVYRPTFSAVR